MVRGLGEGEGKGGLHEVCDVRIGVPGSAGVLDGVSQSCGRCLNAVVVLVREDVTFFLQDESIC